MATHALAVLGRVGYMIIGKNLAHNGMTTGMTTRLYCQTPHRMEANQGLRLASARQTVGDSE
jgi:6-phosphogluconate dehydrogenase